jgi:type VI protein secretion system component Hcp
MKLRIAWIACFFLASLGVARAATVTVVTFGSTAPACAPASDPTLPLPTCSRNTAFNAHAYSWGAANSQQISTSRTTPTVSLSDLNIQKNLDGTSAPLLMSMLNGTVIPQMRIAVYSTDTAVPALTATPRYELLLNNVYVTSIQASDAASTGRPTESVSVTFESIKVQVTTFAPDGTVAFTNFVSYNQLTQAVL